MAFASPPIQALFGGTTGCINEPHWCRSIVTPGGKPGFEYIPELHHVTAVRIVALADAQVNWHPLKTEATVEVIYKPASGRASEVIKHSCLRRVYPRDISGYVVPLDFPLLLVSSVIITFDSFGQDLRVFMHTMCNNIEGATKEEILCGSAKKDYIPADIITVEHMISTDTAGMTRIADLCALYHENSKILNQAEVTEKVSAIRDLVDLKKQVVEAEKKDEKKDDAIAEEDEEDEDEDEESDEEKPKKSAAAGVFGKFRKLFRKKAAESSEEEESDEEDEDEEEEDEEDEDEEEEEEEESESEPEPEPEPEPPKKLSKKARAKAEEEAKKKAEEDAKAAKEAAKLAKAEAAKKAKEDAKKAKEEAKEKAKKAKEEAKKAKEEAKKAKKEAKLQAKLKALLPSKDAINKAINAKAEVVLPKVAPTCFGLVQPPLNCPNVTVSIAIAPPDDELKKNGEQTITMMLDQYKLVSLWDPKLGLYVLPALLDSVGSLKPVIQVAPRGHYNIRAVGLAMRHIDDPFA